MKKLFAVALLFLSGAVHADQTTSRLGLILPTPGQSLYTWGQKLNFDFQILDATIAAVNPLPGSTYYIQNVGSGVQQSSSTFFVSSGTINGPLVVFSTFTPKGIIVAGSGANQITTAAGLLDATKLTGTVPNASLDPSSATKQGNVFNGASQLVQTSASDLILNSLIDPSSVTKQGTNVINLQNTLQSGATFFVSSATIQGVLSVGPIPSTPNPDAYMTATSSVNADDAEINITNKSPGASASANLTAQNDLGSNTSGYVSVGINSSGYSNSQFSAIGSSDSYVLAPNKNLAIIAGDRDVKIYAGGTLSTNLREDVSGTGVQFSSTTGGTTFSSETVRVDGANSSLVTTTATITNCSISSMTANLVMSSHKATGSAAATAAGDLLRFEQMKLVQIATGSISASTATAGTAYSTTTLSVTITPSQTTSFIVVVAFPTAQLANLGERIVLSIRRNTSGTDLGAGTAGLGSFQDAAAANTQSPMPLMGFDTPGSTSAQTYTVIFKSTNGGTVTLQPNSEKAVIMAFEFATPFAP